MFDDFSLSCRHTAIFFRSVNRMNAIDSARGGGKRNKHLWAESLGIIEAVCLALLLLMWKGHSITLKIGTVWKEIQINKQ